MKNETWCITRDDFGYGNIYLCWQHYYYGGYFWASIDVINKKLDDNTPEHPFLFNSREDAIKHLKSLNIRQRCRIERFS